MITKLNQTDRAILQIAIPALAALVIDPLLTLVDTAFVARLGTVELAALGVNAAIVGFAFFAFNFLAFATTPLVARAIGAGRPDEARDFVGSALILATAIGLVVMLVLRGLAGPLVGLMGAEGAVAEEAMVYLRIRAFATVFVLLVVVGHGAFRGHKDTRTPLRVVVGVNLVNLVLDPILIFGVGWGLAGAAWATVVAQGFGAVWFLSLIRKREMARMPRSLADSLPTIMTLGRNGILLIIRSAFLLLTLTFAAATATRIGPTHIAAHQLVAQIFLLSALLVDSVEIAGQALVAEESSRKDPAGIHRLSRRLLFWGLVVGLALMALLGLGRNALGFIASEPVVADLAILAAGVTALVIPICALTFVGDGILMGMLAAGRMALSTLVGAVAGISLMMWSPLGQSLPGIWWALGVFFVVRGVVLALSYRGSVDTAVRS